VTTLAALNRLRVHTHACVYIRTCTTQAWSLSWGHEGKGSRRSGAAAAVASAPSAGKLSLIPRQVTLRELRGASFADVALVPTPAHQPPGSGGVYALASSGVLLLLRATARTVDKAVDLQVPSAYGLAATPAAVAVACSTGIVRIFAARTLAFRVTLPRLAARGEADGSSDSTASGSSHPDARSLSFTADGQRLLVAYADQSLVLWDVSDVKAVGGSLRLSSQLHRLTALGFRGGTE
jgi:hypothetical protein